MGCSNQKYQTSIHKQYKINWTIDELDKTKIKRLKNKLNDSVVFDKTKIRR